MNSFSIAATLAPKGYHKLLTLIFTTIGIKAHGGVRQGGKVMKVHFADEEREHGSFRSWSRDEVRILGVHTTILEKDPTKRVTNGF